METINIARPGKIELVESKMPIHKENEALLKIKYVGICGSDIATYTGNQPFTTYPRIPGHEFSAEIIEIPLNTLGLKVGDIVTANPYFNCKECYSCKKGIVNACTSNQTMGVQRDGAFTEYITMPIERIYKTDRLSAKKLALVEPFTISYHALDRITVKPGDKAIILGSGTIGIFALISAKLKGAEVYVVDIMEKRLNKARDLGAFGVINPSNDNLVDKVNQITNGNGFDIVIEATGKTQAFLSCIDTAAFGANIVLIGNGKQETTFNHSILVKKELNIFGSRNSLQKDFEAVIDIIAKGEVDIEKLITGVYEKEDSIQAFQDLVNNDGTKLKSLIKFA